MNWPWSKRTEAPAPTKLQKRVAKIPTQDLVNWGEQSLNGIGRSMLAYQRSGEETYLQEAAGGAEALLVVLQEISRRSAVASALR